MADERRDPARERDDETTDDLSVHRRERIEGRDFAGASGAATEREQTRDVRAADMVGEPRPDEGPDASAPPFHHDEEVGDS